MTAYLLESVPPRSKAKSEAARRRQITAGMHAAKAAKVHAKKDAVTLPPQAIPYNAAQLDHMRAEFDRCAHWLNEALEHAGELHTLESLWALLESGQSYLWPLPDSAGVVTVADYPKGRMMTVWLAGGKLDQIIAAEPHLAAWARTNGCTHFQMLGRAGWAKALKALDWHVTGAILRRRL